MARSAVLKPTIFAAEKAGARGLRNVHFIDLTDQFCQKDTCWVMQKGAVMYRDNNHLTGNFAGLLAPVLETQLLPLLNAAAERVAPFESQSQVAAK